MYPIKHIQYQKKSRRSPVVEILHFHFKGSRFDSWLGNTYIKKKKKAIEGKMIERSRKKERQNKILSP